MPQSSESAAEERGHRSEFLWVTKHYLMMSTNPKFEEKRLLFLISEVIANCCFTGQGEAWLVEVSGASLDLKTRSCFLSPRGRHQFVRRHDIVDWSIVHSTRYTSILSYLRKMFVCLLFNKLEYNYSDHLWPCSSCRIVLPCCELWSCGMLDQGTLSLEWSVRNLPLQWVFHPPQQLGHLRSPPRQRLETPNPQGCLVLLSAGSRI